MGGGGCEFARFELIYVCNQLVARRIGLGDQVQWGLDDEVRALLLLQHAGRQHDAGLGWHPVD